MHIKDSIKKVRAYRKTRGLSGNAYANRAGVAEGTIRNMDNPEWNPTAETLTKLEGAIPSDFNLGGQ